MHFTHEFDSRGNHRLHLHDIHTSIWGEESTPFTITGDWFIREGHAFLEWFDRAACRNHKYFAVTDFWSGRFDSNMVYEYVEQPYALYTTTSPEINAEA